MPDTIDTARAHHELCIGIIRDAVALGLLATYNPDSRQVVGATGFPDIVIAGPRGVIWVEVKTGRARLSAEQTGWKWTLLAAGMHYALCREPGGLAPGISRDELCRRMREIR